MNKDYVYLGHMIECVEHIEEWMQEGKDVFLNDIKTKDAVLRNLQTLAESAKRLSDDIKRKEPDVNWKKIIGFRNIIVHDYLGLDLDLVWSIMEYDLPTLKSAIEKHI